MRFLSGMYYLEIPNKALQDVEWVEKLPKMEREHGFSAGAREHGIFRDSLKDGWSDERIAIWA